MAKRQKAKSSTKPKPKKAGGRSKVKPPRVSKKTGLPYVDDPELRRARQRRYKRRKAAEVQLLPKLPKCANPARRKAAEASLRVFCETYFPAVFCDPWSQDLLRVIAKIERAICDGETLAIAMPRGSGKTELCRAGVLWAILSCRHEYVVLVSATIGMSKKAMVSIKERLNGNDLLAADFPEVCLPIRALENEPRKAIGQKYVDGKKTKITWAGTEIVLPTIAGYATSGRTICSTSLEGQVRGPSKNMPPDGHVARPSLAICDDPQTRESAKSTYVGGQTDQRLAIINADVRGLSGPNNRTTILVPCTVMYPDDLADRLLDRNRYPAYRGERTRRLYSWPTNLAAWEELRELRDSLLRADEPLDEVEAFYQARRSTCGRGLDDPPDACPTCPRRGECLDCGAQVDWAARKGKSPSALFDAMSQSWDYGAAGFAAEFQNDPMIGDGVQQKLTAEICVSRTNGRARGQVPLEAQELVCFVDVMQSSLWYVIVAWAKGFTGYVVEYGVWPPQRRGVYTLADIVRSSDNLHVRFPNAGVSGAIVAGLAQMVEEVLKRDFPVAGGGLIRIGKLMIDSGKWPGEVAAAKHKISGATVVLSKGEGIKAGGKPMASRRLKAWQKRDPMGHWYMPETKGTREFPYVAIDTNWWKSFIHRGFLTSPGDPGSLTLYGDKGEIHALFASHMMSEYYDTPFSPRGVPVDEWKPRPGKPDNHWFDCIVGCAVAGSVQGIRVGDGPDPLSMSRKPLPEAMSLGELARKARTA